MSAPTPPLLLVTIDTECDKTGNWRTAAPLQFRAVLEGVAAILQPLFADFGIRPTYFLSPEVIANPGTCSVLRDAKNAELATHLHGDYVVPKIKTWDFAGSLTDEMQLEYGAELEAEKLAVLTEMFVQQFGFRPLSFRAGRFGIGAHSGRALRTLGYLADSSVTPHVTWTTRKGEKQPDFKECREFPYAVGPEGSLWEPGLSAFLEVPVTILPPGGLGGSRPNDPIWFRPWYSDAETLCRIVDHVLAQPAQDGRYRPLVMMFHNVEVIPGASPYPQTQAEVSRYLDILKRTFEHVESRGVSACTVAEYYSAFFAVRPDEASISPLPVVLSTLPRALRPGPNLSLPLGMVERVVDKHQAQPWFKYVFRERESRWDCWQPCVWVSENFPRDAAILSLGCGIGLNLLWLAEQGFRNLYGCDIDPKAVATGLDLSRLARLPVKLWVDDLFAPKHIPKQKYAAIEALAVTIVLENFSLPEYLDTYLPYLDEDGVIIIDVIEASYNEVPENQYCTQDWDKPVAQRRPSEYKTRYSPQEVESVFAAKGLAVARVFKERQVIPKTVYVARRNRPHPSGSSGPSDAAHGRPCGPEKPRVLLIADVPDWIFARHCKTLRRLLADEFEFSIGYVGQPFAEENYDLIYPLEFNLVPPEQIRSAAKYVTGVRSHTGWKDLDFIDFVRFLSTHFQRVHVVSRRLYNIFAPVLPSVSQVTHGVDTEFFRASGRTDQSGRKLRLGWAGSRVNPTKGFADFVRPLAQLPGVELVFCGHLDTNLSLEQMRDFYNYIDAYVCASESEGNNNPLMEAAAMERAIITTDNGTVPEYLQHGESALVVDRSLASFSEAILKLRDNPGLRASLGRKARASVVAAFDWELMAERYRQFFRSVLHK